VRLHRLDTDRVAREVVYFAQAASGDGPVKIGFSTDVTRRLADLQFMSPVELSVRLTIPGGQVLEHIFHTRFASLHVRGEWYAETAPQTVLATAATFERTMAADGLPAAVRELDSRYGDLERIYLNGMTFADMALVTGLSELRIRQLLDRMRYLGFDLPWRSVQAARSPRGSGGGRRLLEHGCRMIG
jgi:hypothetical protein